MATIQFRKHQTEIGKGGLNERGHLALLSALAEAPDLSAAATFLLSHVLSVTGATRGLLLGFEVGDEQLTLVSHTGFDEPPPLEYSIGERSHPWMVSTLALSPVSNDLPPRPG